MLDSLQTYQNADGGWPYRPGGSSWTEPTVFALLASYASGESTGRARALDWLRRLQSQDGGWRPKADVNQSTWVTAVVALLPPGDLGTDAHRRAIRWILDVTPVNTSPLFRLRSWLNGTPTAESNQGWPWYPGTVAWSTPTAITILALAKQNRRNPDSALQDRIASARRFLLAHRCPDGGWNHGAVQALGVDASSYPETTGTALLAVAATASHGEKSSISPSVARAEAWWTNCQSCEAASWLMLALRVAGHAKTAPLENLKPRTIEDAALRILAAAGDRGTEIFLA